MQILIAPRPGNLDVAYDRVSSAQGAVADVLNERAITPTTQARLTDGVRLAAQAAAELFLAQPRSDYQDLVLARRQVIDGRQELEQALVTLRASAPGIDVAATVLNHARRAFDAFEHALEILEND